ncbi:hypothetical protein [Rubrivirga sp. IMCC45206]|uniref:hypothetical protein n=1 Tax=Rubrivirga sp. IMCC45206 TaxID=3391614 RepID=UPI003990222B
MELGADNGWGWRTLVRSALVVGCMVVGVAQPFAQVVIRECVEVRPAVAAPDAARSVTDEACAGPVVGRVDYFGTSSSRGQTHDEPDSRVSTLTVETTCGSTSGPVSRGYTVDYTNESGRTYYDRRDSVAIVSVPLRATEGLLRDYILAGGSEVGLGSGWGGLAHRWLCANCNVLSAFRAEVHGDATRRHHAWPDTLACGTSTPLPMWGVTREGAEGWVGPEATGGYVWDSGPGQLVGPAGPVAPGERIDVSYTEAREGAVSFDAPPCAEVLAPESVRLHTYGLGQGQTYPFFVVTPPPPVAFGLRLRNDRDTLAVRDVSQVWPQAVRADGLNGYLESDARVQFTSSPDVLLFRRHGYGHPYRSPLYLRYYDARTSGAYFRLVDSLWAVPATYDRPVRIQAREAGGTLRGDTTVVYLGVEGPGPDSLAVDLGAPAVDCGDSTRVAVRGVLAGEPRAIPDGSSVRLVVRDSTVSRLAWGDSVGVSLRVPVEALRDGTVWAETHSCADIEGDVPVGVYAELDAYWSRDGVVSGEGSTTLRGGAASDGLVVTLSAAVLAPGDEAVVSVEAADGGALDDGDLVDLMLGEVGGAVGSLQSDVGSGPVLFAVPVGSLRDGRVSFVVGAESPPPALTAEAPTEDMTDTGDAPDLNAPQVALPILAVEIEAALSAEPARRGASDVAVLPYGARFDAYPIEVAPGEDILLGVTVVRVPASGEREIQDVLDAWAQAMPMPFVCAEVARVDAGAFAPVYLSFSYGQTASGSHGCAAFRDVATLGLVGTHDTNVRYPAHLPLNDAFPVTAYGGLAVQTPTGWAWATALPGTGVGRPLVSGVTLTLAPAGGRYDCEISTPFEVTQEVVRLPNCTMRGHPSAPIRDSPKFGETGSGWLAWHDAPDQATYCTNPETGNWTPQFGNIVTNTYYSICPRNMVRSLGASRVLSDENDPAISPANVESFVSRLRHLAALYAERTSARDLENAPAVAGAFVASATEVHERSHVSWHGELLRALAYDGIGPFFSRRYPDLHAALVREGVRSRNPALFDRGLAAVLQETTLPASEADHPGAAEAKLADEVEALFDDLVFMAVEARSMASEPLHPVHYRVGGKEVERVIAALVSQYGL